MYIISIYDEHGMQNLSVETPGIIVHILENAKVKFMVYGASGRVEPGDFGMGGFKYWLKRGQTFNSEIGTDG